MITLPVSIYLFILITSDYVTQCFTSYINPEVKPNIIHALDDTNFDFYIQEGRNYQWFIMFVTDSCEHCVTAREEVRTVFSLVNHDDIRFAEVKDINNPLTITRFEVIGYPYIIMIHNGRMWSFNKPVMKNNLMSFIGLYKKNNDKGSSLPPKLRLYYLILFYFQEHLKNYTSVTRAILGFFNVKTDNLFPYEVVVFVQIVLFSLLIIEGFMLWVASKTCLNKNDLIDNDDDENGNDNDNEDSDSVEYENENQQIKSLK